MTVRERSSGPDDVILHASNLRAKDYLRGHASLGQLSVELKTTRKTSLKQ
jgi:hypothetical protein